MNNEAKQVDLNAMSSADLEKELQRRSDAKRAEERQKREAYERFINNSVDKIVHDATLLNSHLNQFFYDSTKSLQGMKMELDKYGEIRSSSKGGFSRISKNGKHKVVYRYTTISDWDERAKKAEDLLREFLGDFVKKRDIKMFNIISALLEKNKEGNLEFSRIQSLYSRESEFDDPRWKEAIKLFKESYKAVDSKMRIEVYKRSEVSNKWELIPLNLSSF